MRERYCLLLKACLAVLVTLSSAVALALPTFGQEAAAPFSFSRQKLRHCTVVTVSQGDRIFFAGNDDYTNRDSCYWVDPGGDGVGYGALYFGEPDNVQQGFNEKGLAYDANGLPDAPVGPRPATQAVDGGYSSYPIKILRACATVEEVIAWVEEHQWHTTMRDQLHFADATGDAVVIGAGPGGELAFTRKAPGDGFLISTNFNRANPSNGSYPCWRYALAEKMLEPAQREGELTVQRMTSIMEAVHLETPNCWTLYSVVADLPQRLLYVYFWFQYDAPAVLDLDKEIARVPAPQPLSALFPPEVLRQADQEYRRLTWYADLGDTAALAWLAAVVGCLVALILFFRPVRAAAFFWIPVVASLGPLGLSVWLFAGRGSQKGTGEEGSIAAAGTESGVWRRALVETANDMTPFVPGTVLVMLAIALVPGLNQGGALLLIAVYGIPLGLGLLLFQGPLLAYATGRGYFRTVFARLPAMLVSTGFALAGILPIAVPGTLWAAQYCSVSLVILLAWAIAALGAVVGGMLLFIYHAWAVRRGITACSALLWAMHWGHISKDSHASTSPVDSPRSST